jgi:hypothetical protein
MSGSALLTSSCSHKNKGSSSSGGGVTAQVLNTYAAAAAAAAAAASIMTELRQLSMMAARFPDFDLAGKEMFLDKVRTRPRRVMGQGAKVGV